MIYSLSPPIFDIPLFSAVLTNVINADRTTAETTNTVEMVPTIDKYDNNLGVRNNAEGKINNPATIAILLVSETVGNKRCK
jgi:hypothetical protein